MNTKIHKLTRLNGVAGQFSIVAAVQYEDEPISHMEFVGNVSGGPVVMLSSSGQTFVTNPERFGNFSKEPTKWVRGFFA
jgi:hypothetical protein